MNQIFKDNSSLDVVYQTSDDTCFYTETNAKNYAQTLEDKKVTKLERGAEDRETQDTGGQSSDGVTPKSHGRMNKTELQANLKSREIDYEESMTNAELVELLEMDDEIKNEES